MSTQQNQDTFQNGDPKETDITPVSAEEVLLIAHKKLLDWLPYIIHDVEQVRKLADLSDTNLAQRILSLIDLIVDTITQSYVRRSEYLVLQESCQKLQESLKQHVKAEQQMKLYIENFKFDKSQEPILMKQIEGLKKKLYESQAHHIAKHNELSERIVDLQLEIKSLKIQLRKGQSTTQRPLLPSEPKLTTQKRESKLEGSLIRERGRGSLPQLKTSRVALQKQQDHYELLNRLIGRHSKQKAIDHQTEDQQQLAQAKSRKLKILAQINKVTQKSKLQSGSAHNRL